MNRKRYTRLIETERGQHCNPNIRQNKIQGKNCRRCKGSRKKHNNDRRH